MKYSDETIKAIRDYSRAQGTNYADGEVRDILYALESTDEQKALRSDAERLDYLASSKTYWLTIQSNPHGSIVFDSSPEMDDLRQAIDKARGG